MKLWDPEYKQKCRARIDELFGEGKSLSEIAVAMNAEGFKPPNAEGFTTATVSMLRSSEHSRARTKEKQDLFHTLVFADDISAERRISLLKAFLRAEDEAA
jgi:hypothetical protein